MAQFHIAERLLVVKVVYYGPAVGGKTTNLERLHELTSDAGGNRLTSLDTEGDRTLFFDLLPMEIALTDRLRLALRLFTVPGQVHYDATRRLVLQKVDGVVFVADSDPRRVAASKESLRNLHLNLTANDVSPGSVPIILQANKRDLPQAVPLPALRAALDLDVLEAHGPAVRPDLIPASALGGDGVFETLEVALRATLAQVHAHHVLGRLGLSRQAMSSRLGQALAPLRERAERRKRERVQVVAEQRQAAAPVVPDIARAEETLPADELLAASVRQSVDLAEALGEQRTMGLALERRVRELEVINDLSRLFVAPLSEAEITEAATRAATTALPGGKASFLLEDRDGVLREASLFGLDEDPFLAAGEPPLAERLLERAKDGFFRDLRRSFAPHGPAMVAGLGPHRTAAVASIEASAGRRGLVLVYGDDPEAVAGPETTRFLAAVRSLTQLALQNSARDLQIRNHQARLEDEVSARTAEARLAEQELAAASSLKDRLLGCVNHELRTPVTKLLAMAQLLERTRAGASPPPGLVAKVIGHAKHLAGLLDQVLSARSLVVPTSPAAELTGATAVVDLARIAEAVAFTCQERAAARQVVIRTLAPSGETLARGDAGSVTLILAQLVENAVKFTPVGSTVLIEVQAAGDGHARVRVTDEGEGVRAEDVERIFGEFDQGGGDQLVAKPAGLGLGLSVARRLARRLHGEVGMAAAAAGAGATFWLELPSVRALAVAGG